MEPSAQSERREMAASLRRLALFLSPLLLVLLAPVFVLWRSGELLALQPQRVASIQQAAPSLLLYGPAFSNCTKLYKLEGARMAAADVLVLGTSRSMQIRSGLFHPDTRFYNAGGGASRVGHFRDFLSGLSADQQPKLMLVSLDQWFFNGRTEAYPEASFAQSVSRCSNALNLVQSSWADIYRDLASGRVHLVSSPHPSYIGLNAQVQSNGFRNDGSYFYGRITAERDNPAAYEDFHFQQTYRRMADGTGRFEPASEPDPRLLQELGRFLDEAKRRGIHVIGFIPPFAPSVDDAMARSGRYTYIPRLFPAIEPIFRARGFTAMDFTDRRQIGIDDGGVVDGVHAPERAQSPRLSALLDADPELGKYTDHALLASLLAASPDPLVVVTDRLR